MDENRLRLESNDLSGKIILVNGASSSGKSTLCRELQSKLEEPYWLYSIDHLRDAQILPMQRIQSGDFKWSEMRSAFFSGFHRSLPAFAAAGNNLLVEHIIETQSWMRLLLELLHPFDVFFIGVHCPLPELERREIERGDRRIGEARLDFYTAHKFAVYDLEIDSTEPTALNVEKTISAWKNRVRPNAFDEMYSANRDQFLQNIL